MKRRIWPWFIVGFLATFVSRGLFKTVHAMLPSGDGVVAMKLWRFYLNELPELPKSEEIQTLGPATVNHHALVRYAVSHFAASAVGGFVLLLAAGWNSRRRTNIA